MTDRREAATSLRRPDPTDDVASQELRRLESALARRDPTGIRGGLGSLIAEDFREFGRSGRVYDAAAMRELIAADNPGGLSFEPASFTVDLLAPGVALVTYELGAGARTRRSSVWVWRDGRWLIRFHQGTPIPPE